MRTVTTDVGTRSSFEAGTFPPGSDPISLSTCALASASWSLPSTPSVRAYSSSGFSPTAGCETVGDQQLARRALTVRRPHLLALDVRAIGREVHRGAVQVDERRAPRLVVQHVRPRHERELAPHGVQTNQTTKQECRTPSVSAPTVSSGNAYERISSIAALTLSWRSAAAARDGDPFNSLSTSSSGQSNTLPVRRGSARMYSPNVARRPALQRQRLLRQKRRQHAPLLQLRRASAPTSPPRSRAPP